MATKNLSQKILEKIKEEHIQPKPKWQFLLKAYLLWFLSALSIFIGSLAFSVILYLIINNDWDVYIHISDSFLKFFILSLPYLWVIIMFLFLLTAYFNFKRTKKGYQYHFYIIIITSIVLSSFFGFILYFIGLGKTLDNLFAEAIPVYEELIFDRRERWLRPDQGFLAGKVESLEIKEAVGHFQLIDLGGYLWRVQTGASTRYMRITEIKEGVYIRVVGNRLGDNGFRADLILPIGHSDARWLKPRRNYFPKQEGFGPKKINFSENNKILVDEKILEEEP